MFDILKIASRNLLRYKRRTALSALLISIGLVAVLMFVAVAGSFKEMMVGQFTDSMVGHMQVHRRGYLGAMESLPVDRNMRPRMLVKLYEVLDGNGQVEAWSPRVKLMAMLSDFARTTSIRLNGVYPEREIATVPLIANRVLPGGKIEPLVVPGEIQVPELLAKPMSLEVGDTVVLVATNKNGSVNGKTFVVRGIMESMSGPGGRDGYIHIDDARSLLRIDDEEVEVGVLARHGLAEPPQETPANQSLFGDAPEEERREYLEETRQLFLANGWGRPAEVSEIAIRQKNPERLEQTLVELDAAVADLKNRKGMSIFQLHPWAKFVPFSKIANMIDLMNMFIKVILISVVLISIMNVLIMAVYERIREIGTISAIGTQPRKILLLFLSEGFLLSLLGTIIGSCISLLAIGILHVNKLTFSFGRQENLELAPWIGATDVLGIAGITILVAVLASLQPAWKASRMDPITALRHV